jgi:hypothetical protein
MNEGVQPTPGAFVKLQNEPERINGLAAAIGRTRGGVLVCLFKLMPSDAGAGAMITQWQTKSAEDSVRFYATTADIRPVHRYINRPGSVRAFGVVQTSEEP